MNREEKIKALIDKYNNLLLQVPQKLDEIDAWLITWLTIAIKDLELLLEEEPKVEEDVVEKIKQAFEQFRWMSVMDWWSDEIPKWLYEYFKEAIEDHLIKSKK